jgi:uncharacterized protein (TIGR02001 family)
MSKADRGRLTFPLVMLALSALLLPRSGAAAGLWEGLVAASSDNVYRGLTQTQGDPALLADVHYRLESGWFAGVSAATVNINPGPGAPVEIDLYAGFAMPLSRDWTGKLTLLRYEYPGDQPELPYAYEEIVAGFSFRDWLFANVSYSPDTSRYTSRGIAYHRPANSVELAAQLPLRPGWSIDAGVGRYAIAAPVSAGYWYWNTGITFNAGPLQIAVEAIGTDRTARALFGDKIAGQRWVASIVRHFARRP